MLAHSFGIFYIVTNFILPLVIHLKFSPIDFNEKCKYLNDDYIHGYMSKEYISSLKVYCKKIVPFLLFCKEQISSYNHTAHNILTNEIALILPNIQQSEKKREV